MSHKRSMAVFGVLSLNVVLPAFAQDKKEDPPPIVIKRGPPTQKEPVPTTDQYPLAEALRALESGNSPQTVPEVAPTLPSISNATPGKPSIEVPREFQPKHDIVLSPTGQIGRASCRERV